MNREIKFRAFNLQDNEMYSNEVALKLLYGAAIGEPQENKWVLMQFTGLTDKNGAEIYEGDVVKYKDIYEHICVVKYGQGCYYGENQNKQYGDVSCFHFHHCTVLGNIHEHQRLLK